MAAGRAKETVEPVLHESSKPSFLVGPRGVSALEAHDRCTSLRVLLSCSLRETGVSRKVESRMGTIIIIACCGLRLSCAVHGLRTLIARSLSWCFVIFPHGSSSLAFSPHPPPSKFTLYSTSNRNILDH